MIDAVSSFLQGRSPEAQAAVIGGIAGGLVGGVVGGVFTVISVALGLLGEPWVRSRGKVRCQMEPIEMWGLDEGELVTLHRLPLPSDLLPLLGSEAA